MLGLEEIFGLDSLEKLYQLDCFGNETLVQIGDLNKVIMQNEELSDLNLDVLLFPDAVKYDIKSEKINEETLRKFDDMNISWYEILSSGKNIKINNYQMMQMHKKACNALEEYVPKYCESRTTVLGIEQYLAENVKYDYDALKNGHSHSYSMKSDNLPSITTGPLGRSEWCL